MPTCYAADLGNATDKTCYNITDIVSISGSSDADYVLNLFADDGVAGGSSLLLDPNILHYSIISSVELRVLGSNIVNYDKKRIIVNKKAEADCNGQDYDACLTASIESTGDYYASDIDLSFNGCGVPEAASVMTSIMDNIIYTTTSFVLIVFATYWPYILIIGIIGSLVVVLRKLLHIGIK